MKNPLQEARMLRDRSERLLSEVRNKRRKLHEEQLVLEGEERGLLVVLEGLRDIVKLQEGCTVNFPKEPQ